MKIKRIWYNDVGRVQEEELPILCLLSDSSRHWDQDNNMVLQILDNSIKKPPKKKIKQGVGQKSTNFSTEFVKEILGTGIVYGDVQKKNIWFFYQMHQHLPNYEDILNYRNSWFPGICTTVNTTLLVKYLAGIQKKGGKNNKIIRYNRHDSLYTAYINGKNKCTNLSSRATFLHEKGYIRYENHRTKRSADYIAYYDTAENAAKALKILVFSEEKQRLFEHPTIQPLFHGNDQVALFETIQKETKEVMFFGILVKNRSEMSIYLPSLEGGGEICSPWYKI